MIDRPGTSRVYLVLTWSPERQTFTSQAGVPYLVMGQAGLRVALRMLRRHGYDARKGDSSVLVERIR